MTNGIALYAPILMFYHPNGALRTFLVVIDRHYSL
jgi:hypothetical protein